MPQGLAQRAARETELGRKVGLGREPQAGRVDPRDDSPQDRVARAKNFTRELRHIREMSRSSFGLSSRLIAPKGVRASCVLAKNRERHSCARV